MSNKTRVKALEKRVKPQGPPVPIANIGDAGMWFELGPDNPNGMIKLYEYNEDGELVLYTRERYEREKQNREAGNGR